MNEQIKISFEFFPPRSDVATANLLSVHAELNRFQPEYFSVTFGAGGSTQKGTFSTVKALMELGSTVVPHLTCVGSSKDDMRAILDAYIQLGVNGFLILRGDLPKQKDRQGDFEYASDLVAFIRREYPQNLHLEVAAYPEFHPESNEPQQDLLNFKNKVDAGANGAITQYFYNKDSFMAYRDELDSMGVDIPISAGIMPIVNYPSLLRFSTACGAELPRWLLKRLEQYKDDEKSLQSYGMDVVTQLCSDLLDAEVHGLHFYSLNKADPVSTICQRLGYQMA